MVNPNGGVHKEIHSPHPCLPLHIYTLLSIKIGLLMLMKLYFLRPTFH